jgi:transcriptional regulator with XRE-family HTH domain
MLRAWREESGLALETVCGDMHRAGTPISYPWLQRLESGKTDRSPSLAILTALATYYGKNVRDLLPGAEAAS